MFGFTLWVLIHKRSSQVNIKVLLPSMALYVLATMVSQLMEFVPQMIHLMFDYIKHLTISAY